MSLTQSSFSQALLPEFDHEMANTRKILACVPDGHADFKPHPKSMALGRLAGHVAEMPFWASTTLEVEVLQMDKSNKPYVVESTAAMLERFDKAVVVARDRIAAASEEDWGKMWTFEYEGKKIISMPRAEVMRETVMNHMIHHRAQLGVYLRLQEVALPGTYGPSADEMKFWETAKA